MIGLIDSEARRDAVERARRFSPFLREALEARPELGHCFLEKGSQAAIAAALVESGGPIEVELRRARLGLALTIALGDLSGELELEEVTRSLSQFADRAIGRALTAAVHERVADGEPAGIAVIALGKLGSCELNYSSDVDLLLLFDPRRLPRRERDDAGEAAVRIARRMIEILQKRTADGYVARVDLRLRPSPEVTPIALPVNAAISHYESSALPWERAAFIRARAAAGDQGLGRHFLDSIEPFVWRRSLDFGVIDDIRQISARIRDHFAQGGRLGPGYDLKRGRGGIREVEFFTQIQQMIHGGRDPSVRVPATLDALEALAAAGRLDGSDVTALADAYRLLRTVEHRVQMIEDAQTHKIPADAEALDGVAGLHGLTKGGDLLDLLRPHVERAESLFDGLAPETGRRLSNDPDILLDELRTIGFRDPEAAARRIADLRSGRARSLRSPAAQTAFEAMLPGLLAAIAAGPDPSHALNRLTDIVERLSSGVNLYRLLEARPKLGQLLAKILAHAPALSEQLARRPELLEGLFDASSFDPPPSAEDFAARLSDAMRGQPYDVALDRARRMVNERRFALGVQLIDRRDDPLNVAAGYSRVAEGALLALANAAVREFESAHGRIPGGELVILGLGRLGGCSLTHASDLDLIYLYTGEPGVPSDGAKPLGPADYFNRLASRITAALSVPTAAGPLYDVDTRLRPQGAKGMLTVPLDGFAAYQREEAWTWEHMALCRARPVLGSPAVRDETAALIDEILRRPRDDDQIAADAARMHGEIERHKPPAGRLDVKLGPGGLVDLEFAVHVLQLTRHVGLNPRLEEAVRQLAEAGLIERNVVQAQRLLTRMLVMLRLVAPDGSEPNPETWELVAAACGVSDARQLLAEHDAARQDIAALWNSIKGERG
ncbi:bifunctional [glutamine synthetase] adenylyltransferase/[glutamine synthetase]-adenylyl-L-tyrosine phosphorylase [Sphingomonas sp.]|uniref:bifunctional [glutamine synthetase] adenylyltransferase/[glutamine synthetase]-adenylyl-L-tyrosine phosphorylase n=1 Tax=Sphingomonas sp. TaxID=28214 RepID=UPI0017C17DD3|nr:bifunctional [glutamine synthetase] adenylyltransferase/[glutamine synthetase]-adenylyl-L-tyrosine phosphorylase [Sphingomonas sp.]MBA3510926.1 bifunctional [glutamine synthetase] adenylyltransferase/[glutamine synthetase]-adenylyl-L-tyrosine phosphorylase [Sphingomonas sp.]